MVSIAETGSTIREEEHATPTIKPLALLLETVIQDSPEKISIDGVPMKTTPKINVEGCFEEDPTEVARMEKMVDNLEKDLTMMMKMGGSLEMATPARHFLTSTAHVGPSDPTPRAPFITEILQSAVEYLKNLLYLWIL